MPKVSVITSVYNGERFLTPAIESILAQTYKDFELTMLDDGSTDRSWAIIQRHARSDSRIRPIKQQNIGLTRSLNKGIAISRGEYVARMDADDVSVPERLQKQVQFLDRNDSIAMVGTSFYVVNEEGEVIDKRIAPVICTLTRNRLMQRNPFLHSSVMIRKQVLEEVGLYDETLRYCQDYELWLRVACKFQVYNMIEPLVMSRVSRNRISNVTENRQLWYCILARRMAIRKAKYPILCYCYLIPPFLKMLMPVSAKFAIRKHLLGSTSLRIRALSQGQRCRTEGVDREEHLGKHF